ncbi:MAG: hypothetical protein EAX95_03005 [Candidatus Thorarchaeota archaeon]|nr:hypothetical protein [Candidatus Thorarchaeota archaeon]
MKLPVCIFDIESDMLCSNCQDRLDRGEITRFDVDFSKWLLDRAKEYPSIEDLNLQRAIRTAGHLILVVKKKNAQIFESLEALVSEMKENFGEILIFEQPVKMRKVIRQLIEPAIEVGVNSLYLPDGTRESIVMLRDDDRERIVFSKEKLRDISSAVLGEPVIFQYQDERAEKVEDAKDAFDERMEEFSSRRKRG